jgi:hypothetical protein
MNRPLSSLKLNFKFPKIPDQYKDTAYLYASYIYFGAIGLSTFYGIKKGIEKWWQWKQIRQYRKISIDYIESVINTACDGGVLVYYILMCSSSNALVAATSPVSVPILLYFFEKPEPKKDHDDSLHLLTNTCTV